MITKSTLNLKKLSMFMLAAAVVATSAGAAEARHRDVAFNNLSSRAIVGLYVSPTYNPDWTDQLGQGLLFPGQQFFLKVDGNEDTGTCYFDVRAVNVDGEEMIDWGVNFCSVTDITYY